MIMSNRASSGTVVCRVLGVVIKPGMGNLEIGNQETGNECIHFFIKYDTK